MEEHKTDSRGEPPDFHMRCNLSPKLALDLSVQGLSAGSGRSGRSRLRSTDYTITFRHVNPSQTSITGPTVLTSLLSLDRQIQAISTQFK
jgi:hypothetical protein